MFLVVSSGCPVAFHYVCEVDQRLEREEFVRFLLEDLEEAAQQAHGVFL